MDNFWLPTTPWAHPGRDVVMPFRPETVQQMVWSEDLGALVAKAFLQGDKYINLEIDLAGDALTGPEIAAVFSLVTGRPMSYRRGPHPLLLYLASSEGYMHAKYVDQVGNTASVGQCRKLLPTLHTLEQTLRENGWESRPSFEFQQPALSCHTCDCWIYSLACPCCVAGYVAHDAEPSRPMSGPLCCLLAFVGFPCTGAVTRGRLRRRYGIHGSCPLDWCCHICCPFASLVQEAAEVRQQRQLRALYPDPAADSDLDVDMDRGTEGPMVEKRSLVERYARNPNDKELQKAMKKKRKQQAKQYDWEIALPDHF